MFYLVQQKENDFIVVMAFRESGKSTILNTANVLWSILGRPQKKFVLIVSKTQEQAKNHFSNIKSELQTNDALREDFGPFTENEKDWNKMSLELEYCGAKIMSVTMDQAIRGLKYGQHRPDLIILDDVENSTMTVDETDVLYAKFQSEILPVGSEHTRIIVLGNLLSKDSFIMQLKDEIEKDKTDGIFRAYPLLDDSGKTLWPSRFPDLEAVKKLRKNLDENTWSKEYILNTIGFEGYMEEYVPGENIEKEVSHKYFYLYQKMLMEWHMRYGYHLYSRVPQIPLLDCMKEFNISAPIVGEFCTPEVGDKYYDEYILYENEKEKMSQEYIREFKQSLRDRATREEIRSLKTSIGCQELFPK